MTTTTLAGLAALAIAGVAHADVTFHVSEDYMTSGFFQSAPFVRGQEAESSRAVNRVTSGSIFGLVGENAYFNFDFDASQFDGPVTGARFVVETALGGFGADPTDENRASVSVHSVSANPLDAIDLTSAASWQQFRADELTSASVVDTVDVGDVGIYEWDVTGLVNAWIAGGDSQYAYTIATSSIHHEGDDFFLGFVNSSAVGEEGAPLTARLVIVPAPGMGALLLSCGVVAGRRRR